MTARALFTTVAAVMVLGCNGDGNGPGVDPSIQILIPPGVDSQVAGAGDLLPVLPAVIVQDANGNPIAGRTVHFQVTAGGGVVTDPDVVTGSDGIVSVDDWRLGSAGGRNALKATVENGPSVTLVAYGVTVGVATGGFHSCGISTGGIARCWGENDQDQLGDGSSSDQNEPVPVNTTERFFALAPGGEHTCGINLRGFAYCWGLNDKGQLGTNSLTGTSTPTRVDGDHVFAQLSAGTDFTCGLEVGGIVWCWGNNEVGQLGNNSDVDKLVPVQVVSNERFVALDAGLSHVCAIATDGEAHCWGFNEHGGTGNSGPEEQQIPVPAAAGHTFISIDAGNQHTCAVKSDQTIFCWGLNATGQLGDGTTSSGLQARQVVDSTFFLPFVSVTAGLDHTCALINGGEAYCWGSNFLGVLGDGTSANRLNPSAVLGGFTFSSISSFGFHTCARRSDGFAFCWGNNGGGQLGNAQNTNSPVPVGVETASVFLGR